jgi:hypothetical protein
MKGWKPNICKMLYCIYYETLYWANDNLTQKNARWADPAFDLSQIGNILGWLGDVLEFDAVVV